MDKNKNILSINLEPDYALIGIVSSANDYHLSWILNLHFKINLVQSKEIQIALPEENNSIQFSTFSYFDSYNNCVLKLISNKANNAYLLKKNKKIDFILFIDSNFVLDFKDYFIKESKLISSILAIMEIPVYQLAEKEKKLILVNI